jgi:hypothetical protein
LALAASTLAAGGVLHSAVYSEAKTVFAGSGLPSFFASACNGLWTSDSANLFSSALTFAAVAAWPRLAKRPLILLLTLPPLSTALSVYVAMGFGFFPAHVLLGAGLAAVLAALAHREQPVRLSGSGGEAMAA